MTKRGFTLIEVLVVISIMGIMGMILTEIFIRSLRGGNKAEVLAILKQNGQSVLETMDKNIRNSEAVVCTDSAGEILVLEKAGIYTRYRFIDGQLGEDHPILTDSTQDQFRQDICTNSNYSNLDPTILTDFEKVAVTNSEGKKIFTSSEPSGFKAIVTINFMLEAGGNIPKSVRDQIDPVPFVTTIQVR